MVTRQLHLAAEVIGGLLPVHIVHIHRSRRFAMRRLLLSIVFTCFVFTCFVLFCFCSTLVLALGMQFYYSTFRLDYFCVQ
jgi:hypothetical protein